ncbi:MAG: ATP-binding protein, partial [Oscillospiraceae bacterium]|nr:ATP-binding protein [Oscillospiraceae bacterium]
MRTPLNAILGLTGLCLEGGEMDAETGANLEKIHNAGDMLLSIVNDILDISKIEAGKMELVAVRYDVPSLINDAVTQNILRIGEKPIEFRLDIGTDMFAALHGDELRVKQIVNNLLSNAIKYTDEGHVELSVHCERDGDAVWLTARISDTGKGIRPEDMGRLFADYSQLDAESNRNTEGTGLGLPITKSLAEMMGGTIEVESEYGKGSAFTVRLRQGFVSDVHIGEDVVRNLRRFVYSDDRRGKDSKVRYVRMPYARVLVVDD